MIKIFIHVHSHVRVIWLFSELYLQSLQRVSIGIVPDTYWVWGLESPPPKKKKKKKIQSDTSEIHFFLYSRDWFNQGFVIYSAIIEIIFCFLFWTLLGWQWGFFFFFFFACLLISWEVRTIFLVSLPPILCTCILHECLSHSWIKENVQHAFCLGFLEIIAFINRHLMRFMERSEQAR